MDLSIIGIFGVIVFVGLAFLGVPIAVAAAAVGSVGILIMRGSGAMLSLMAGTPFSETAKFTFIVLPLFVVMGHIAFAIGLTDDLFQAARRWVGWLPGGLYAAVFLGGAAFAALSGSSTAAAAVLTRVALPEMEKRGYHRGLAAGCFAQAGTLAIVIPPSALMVIYGIMTEQSVAKLLIAGFVPGLLLALLYMIETTLMSWRNPSLGPPEHGWSWKERMSSLSKLGPAALLAVLVTGGIYTGIFTPTEAGAAGAVGALVLGVVLRRLSRRGLGEALAQAGRTTSVVFIVIVGTIFLVRFLALTGLPYALGRWLIWLPVPPMVILIGILFLYLLLGTIMTAIGVLMLTLPVVFPAVQALGFDPVWFGILTVLLCEIGSITPPVGLNLFAVQAMAPDIPPSQIARYALLLCICDVTVVILVIAFPQIALWLPGTMGS